MTRQENEKPKNTVMEEYFNISFQRYSCFFPLILDIHTLMSLACEEALLGFPGVRGVFFALLPERLGRACSQAMISLISTILLQSNKLLSHKDAGILFQMSMHTD